MAEFKTTGIVLKRQDFGDADRILKIFTKDFGLLSALAKGCKKVKSRRSGAFELFSESNFRLHRKTGELFLVTDAHKVASFENADLSVLKFGYSAAEWLLTLAPLERPLPQTYAFTKEFLISIQNGQKLELLELAFQVKLLDKLGFLPEFSSTGSPAINGGIKDREARFFKFVLSYDFKNILRLEDNVEVFERVKKILMDIFEREAEKTSKVAISTQGWE